MTGKKKKQEKLFMQVTYEGLMAVAMTTAASLQIIFGFPHSLRASLC
jgi:hypothetical protein